METFKVGDRVKVKSNANTINRRIVGQMGTIKGIVYGGCVVEFDKEVSGTNCGGLTKDGFGWVCAEKILSTVKNETIVIYRDGQKVIAFDKYTGKKAEAKCNLDDEFDFHTGAKLAFQRLFDGVKDKICVGDTVKVVNGGKQFSAYDNWSGLAGYRQNFVVGSHISTEDNYKVLVIKKHDTDNRRTVALIQNPKTTQVFIINIEGISKVER